MVKCTGRGLVVKRPGALSKDQMLNLVLGVGVFSLLPILSPVADIQQASFNSVLARLAVRRPDSLALKMALTLWISAVGGDGRREPHEPNELL